LAVLATALAVGCAGKSPEEKVAGIRALYSARLNGFIIEEEPLPVAEVEIDESADAEVLEEEVMIEPTPIRQQARLDILILHDSYELLPGVTVDISMANSAGEEKNHWRVWFDTSDVGKASVTQFTHVLEDISYEEGDGFFAEVRNPIPVDEWEEYREFSEPVGES
jgi:hypothetical protein